MSKVNIIYMLYHLKFIVLNGIIPAILLTVLCSLAYFMVHFRSVKCGCKKWFQEFKKSTLFRWRLFLVFYIFLIISSTLIGRSEIDDPLRCVTGDWWIYRNGHFNTPVVINLLMFVPLPILIFQSKLIKPKKNLPTIIITSSIVLAFSVGIEVMQLITRRGSFQISDTVYNTLSGFVSTIVYLWKERRSKKSPKL